MGEGKTPQGVIGIFTTPGGEVVATAPVFERICLGGWTMRDAQKSLARRRLAFEVAKAYCSTDYAKVIPEHNHESIMNNMTRNSGFRVSFVEIGYDEEAD